MNDYHEIKYNDEELRQVMMILEEKGIVTRDEWPSIDLRTYSRGLYKVLVEKGLDNIDYIEPALDGYTDCSGVLFDINKYDPQSAEEYMRRYVLKSERD